MGNEHTVLGHDRNHFVVDQSAVVGEVIDAEYGVFVCQTGFQRLNG